MSERKTVTFWYGCNAVRHGDILHASKALLEAIDIDVRPAGGPAYCCGTAKDANLRAAEGMATRAVENFNTLGHDVVTWCPSCHRHLGNFIEGYQQPEFNYAHITQILHGARDRLRARLTRPIHRRVMLHEHFGFHEVAVNGLVRELLALVPGLDVVAASDSAPGHMCSALATVPAAFADVSRGMTALAREHKVDDVVTIFHSCQRMLCALEGTEPFRVVNYVNILAESTGLDLIDDYKTWKLAESEEALVAQVGPERIARIGETVFRSEVMPELRKRPVK
ncbi:MAG: (Fe-S)-binding protein [Burkholderiales bacterium]